MVAELIPPGVETISIPPEPVPPGVETISSLSEASDIWKIDRRWKIGWEGRFDEERRIE